MNNDTIAHITEPQPASEEMNALFAQLRPEDIEQFYQAFQRWSLQRQIETLQAEIAGIQEAIAENAIFLEKTRPSAIALATLAQLQARGVNDLDLLDKMLERGESWLDHTMQLLTYCERFGVMRGSYTEWCEHALEGAYEWIRSMHEAGATSMPPRTPADHDQRFDEATESLLLQKLMSEGEETIKLPAIGRTHAKITQPLAERKATQPLAQRKITQPLAQRKITQPLAETESELMPEASAAPTQATGAIEASTPSTEFAEAEPGSVILAGEAHLSDDMEAPATETAVTVPEEIESADERTEQTEEGAGTTVAEAEAATAIVTEPGEVNMEPESTGAAAEPADHVILSTAKDLGSGAETVTASEEAAPADVATEAEVIDASSAPEAGAEASEPGEQPGQEAETPAAALQEVEQEASIAAGSPAGDVQTQPETEESAEITAQDAIEAPRAAEGTLSEGQVMLAASAGVNEEAASEEPPEMVEASPSEPAIDTVFSRLEDTQPLPKVVSPPPESAGHVEAIPFQTESAGQQGQYHAPPEQRPRKRRFSLWRRLANLFRGH